MRVPFARFALAGLFAVAAFAATPGYTADAPKLTRDVAKTLSEAQTAMKANDLATALSHVKEAQAVADRTPFDDYTINQFLGSIYIQQQDWKNAALVFEAMSDSPALPPENAKEVLTNTVLIDNNAQRMDKVAVYGAKLEALGPLDSKVAGTIAVAYYNAGNTQKAQAIAEAEQKAATAAGRTPDQAILDILTRVQMKNDPEAANRNLEMVAQSYNDPRAWHDVILNAFVKGVNETKALYLYRLLVVTNAELIADDYTVIADITTKAGYPAETVAFLEHGQSTGVLKPGDKTSAALNAARAKVPGDKKSLPAFDAEAKAKKTGDYDVKVAETYYGYAQYAQAEEVANRAIAKGGIKDMNEAYMILGASLAAQGKNADAAAAFQKVSGDPAWMKVAHVWTVYAQRKTGTAAAPAPAQH